MIDITAEAKRVIEEKDYILDARNYYEISTDTIHIRSDDFSNPIKMFVLLHEVAHRYQAVLLRLDEIDTPTLEREANDIAYAALRSFNVNWSPRYHRFIDNIVKPYRE